MLVCRNEGIDWAVLFNSDSGMDYAGLIDPLLHKPARETKHWPEIDLVPRL